MWEKPCDGGQDSDLAVRRDWLNSTARAMRSRFKRGIHTLRMTGALRERMKWFNSSGHPVKPRRL